MRFSYVTLLTALSLLELPNVLGAVTFADPAELKIRNDKRELEKLTQKALDKILTKLDKDEEELKKAGKKATCTRKTLRYKLEFGSMQKKDRKGYTDAVTCLQKLKAKTPAAIAPGARGRNDDFVVTHVLQTPYVHMSGTFLGWHRYYLWVYEEALRNECGYKGPIPYWDWPKWADAPQDSPLFNGDAYSLGGNGDFIPGHPGLTLNFGNTTTVLPAGLGGGCVTKGPFKDMVVNLGPVLIGTPGPLPSGLGYNPRCLKRDVGPAVAMRWSNYTSVLETFKREDIGNFQTFIQGPGTETATESGIGVHGGGHYTISGDPGGDPYVSPGDPGFFLHHAQVDRLWTLWQGLDPDTRQYALSGTNTMFNEPPSEDTTLDFLINVGYSGGTNLTMREVMSTTKGPFCYVYL